MTPQLEHAYAHLAAEAECLRRLVDLLEQEAGALRALDHATLGTCLERKRDLEAEHLSLVKVRGTALSSAHPEGQPIATLSALLAALPSEHIPPFTVLCERLRALGPQAVELQARNKAFAETGHALVARALRRSSGRAGGPRTTYGANARIQPGRPNARILRRG